MVVRLTYNFMIMNSMTYHHLLQLLVKKVYLRLLKY